MTEQKNRDIYVIWTALACLIDELAKAKAVETSAVVESIQGTAALFRKEGDALQLADTMHRLSLFLLKTIPDLPSRPPIPPSPGQEPQ